MNALLYGFMKLSVIIVNYNVKYFLEQCLYSALQAVRSLDAEIIVIDNNSSDGSIEYLSPSFPDVIFIKSGSNLGFGKANNLALQSARGEYILFLNPDTLIPEDCIEKCLRFIDKKPSAGALGIRMLDGCGSFLPESKRSFPTTATAFYKLAGLSAMFPNSRHFNRYALGYLDQHSNHAVEVLAGAFMLVRKDILDKTGGFDEQFFMYGEDIDLSYRIQQAGYENWYFSESSIIHFKGESTKKESLKYLKMFYHAMMVFVNKHYKGRSAWLTRSVLKAGIGLRGVASWFYSPAASIKRMPRARNKIIAGSKAEFEECLRILKPLSVEQQIVHYISDQENLFDIGRLKQEANSNDATEIIFCNGLLPYSTIIEAVEKLGAGFTYRFHASGSNSIVGSDSRSSVGETIASY